MDSAARMRDLIVVAGRLITLVTEETRLLEAYRTSDIGALQDEKGRLSRIYVGLVRDLKRDPELLAAVEKAVREELSDVLRRFEAAAEANANALNTAREANERVMRAIVEAASAQQTTVAGYSRTGTLAAPSKAAASRPLSMTVNQRL
jgi:Lon protease-like protein